MRKLINRIKRFFNPLYSIVYTTKDGRTEMYTIDKPSHAREFGNVSQSLRTAGFRAYCYNRQAVRSFRYDRIVALNKA
jgi:hypothetical protein